MNGLGAPSPLHAVRERLPPFWALCSWKVGQRVGHTPALLCYVVDEGTQGKPSTKFDFVEGRHFSPSTFDHWQFPALLGKRGSPLNSSFYCLPSPPAFPKL